MYIFNCVNFTRDNYNIIVKGISIHKHYLIYFTNRHIHYFYMSIARESRFFCSILYNSATMKIRKSTFIIYFKEIKIMPHIRIRGIEKEVVKAVGKELVDEMVVVMKCPKDIITLEYIETLYIADGIENTGILPMVEIAWFDKGEDVKQKVADAVTRIINSEKEVDRVAVYFIDMIKEHYFANGVHY